MQALHQWSFPTFGLADKFACTTQHPAVMPPPQQPAHLNPPVNTLKRAADRDSNASSPKRCKLTGSASTSQSLSSQQPRPSVNSIPAQAHSQSAESTPVANDNNSSSSSPSKPGLQFPQESQSQRTQQPVKLDSSKLDLARSRIESQFNLEILLKHDELRLIEQELAKAQICLEQIRRCRVIPFPGQPGAASHVDDISNGTGCTVEPQSGLHRPAHASPWGVDNGPYSQHYARWLLPDPEFDATLSARPRNSVGGKSLESRGLRSVVGDALATSRRRQRPSVDVGTPLSPSTAAPPRIPGGPLLLTRADGVRVKLVCRHCSKEDINSVQGFLNHCRIAHGDSMKTHAEAAATHGVPLEDGEVPASTPIVADHAPPTPAVATSVIGNTHKVNVHPLNVAGRNLQPPSTPTVTTPVRPSPLSSSFTASSGYFPAVNYTASPVTTSSKSGMAKQHSRAPMAASTSESNFVGSSQTPSLSALAQKRGFGLDLAKLVTSAKERVDLDQIESLVPDNEVEENANSSKSQPMARQPSGHPRGMVLSGLAGSDTHTAGARGRAQAPSPLALDVSQHNLGVIPDSASSSFQQMLPNSSPHGETAAESLSPRSAAHTAPTSEANPGLMTDREDEPEDDDSVVADSEDDRRNSMTQSAGARRDVRIHGEDFPMPDIPANGTGDDKLSQSREGTISTPSNVTNVEKKRGRPRKQK